MSMFCRVLMTLVKACLIIYVLMYFWLQNFENREMMKAVVHWQAKNHVSVLTFHHDKISESGSFEHLNNNGTHLDEAEYESMTEGEKAETIGEEDA